MNKPVIVFTSWKRQDTNGNTMLAPVSGPHATPSRAAHDVAAKQDEGSESAITIT